jgi:hypothetical protein
MAKHSEAHHRRLVETAAGSAAGEAENASSVVNEFMDVHALDHQCRALLGADGHQRRSRDISHPE